MRNTALAISLCLLLTACAPGYQLVKPGPVKVSNGGLQVQPTMAWNRAPYHPGGIPSAEAWTQNGLPLDQVWFFGGVKDGQSIAKQAKKADRQVPKFRPDMLPQDLASLMESYYLLVEGAKIFDVNTMKPATVAGASGIRLDFSFVGDSEVPNKGSAVLVVKDQKLYGMILHGAALHYYDTLVPEFDRLVSSAVLLK